MTEAVRHLSDYDIENRYRATVVSSERITPEASGEEIREIVLDVESPQHDYTRGQCIGVIVPGAASFGHTPHFRLYTVADLPARGEEGGARVTIAVQRCEYVDEYNGERYPGIASNYLCDLRSGDRLEITGPYPIPFKVPDEHDANLILIGSGTGIAPFRALIKHIDQDVEDWTGRIWLFYGARSGLEMVYMNEESDDFARHVEERRLEAFKAFSPRPSWDAPIDWAQALGEKGEELWALLGDPHTYVYLAGLEKMLEQLDVVFAGIAGSEQKWQRRKAELIAGGRWVELVY